MYTGLIGVRCIKSKRWRAELREKGIRCLADGIKFNCSEIPILHGHYHQTPFKALDHELLDDKLLDDEVRVS